MYDNEPHFIDITNTHIKAYVYICGYESYVFKTDESI